MNLVIYLCGILSVVTATSMKLWQCDLFPSPELGTGLHSAILSTFVILARPLINEYVIRMLGQCLTQEAIQDERTVF